MARGVLQSLFPCQVSAPLADVFVSLLEMWHAASAAQSVSRSVSSRIRSRRWKVSGPITMQNQSTVERISSTTVLGFETTWCGVCIACHQRRAVPRRSSVWLGSAMWSLLTQQSVSKWCIPSWATWPQRFVSEGTGWKHLGPPHLFQRHPLHVLLHVSAFSSFIFLPQTGWSLTLIKSLVKQRVYKQHQLMCDLKSWSDSAVLGKNRQGRRQVGVRSIRTLPFGSDGWRSNKLGMGSGGEAINLQGFLETALLCLLSSFVFLIPLSWCLT